MELVAYVGSDKDSWGQIAGLINRGSWDKIVLIGSSVEEYPAPERAEIVKINSQKPLSELKQEIMQKLKDKFSEFEVCLSIASGNGKEHMALVSALLSIPMGIRLVAFTKEGVNFIN